MTATLCPECHLTIPCFEDHDPPRKADPRPEPDVVLFARRPQSLQPPRLRPRPPVARPRDGQKCDHEPADRYVCKECINRLTALLRHLPSFMTELEIAITKQARMGDSGAGSGIPYAPIASEQAWATRQTVLIWVDEIASIRGHSIPDTWTGISAYLRESAAWIGMHPAGWWITDELIDAITAAERVIDRPEDRLYVGRCGALIAVDGLATTCSNEVYARRGAPNVGCRRCGTVHDVQGRRDSMLDQIWDDALAAADLVKAVNGILGTDTVGLVTIRQWKRRGHIVPVDVDDRGRPLYLVSDVVNRALGRVPPPPAQAREGA